MQYGHISTIPTQSTNSLIVQFSDEGGHLHEGPGKRVVEIVHQKAYYKVNKYHRVQSICVSCTVWYHGNVSKHDPGGLVHSTISPYSP